MNHSWSLYIIVVTVANLLGLSWLLFATARRRKDDRRGDNDTTGHVWDGDLTELNKPLPRWWLGLFVLTMLFAVGYLLLYPGLGGLRGTLGWSSEGELAAQVGQSSARQEARLAKFRDQPLDQLVHDGEALKTGHNVFANNCIACHGSDARGAKGFPDLTDNDWLYGGDAETVLTSVRDGRSGAMPALAAALPEGGVAQVANYVRSLSGLPHDDALANAGQPKFEMICAACHGKDGKGNTALGAPNLSDGIWLYGGTQAAIEETITNGRNGKMPAWAQLLGPDRTRLVAAWVLSQSAAKKDVVKQGAPTNETGGGAP